MMKRSKIGILFLLIIAIYSCSNKNSIFKNYDCQITPIESKKIVDALNKFTLNIPNNWKTELYIDKGSSIFVTADTTKQLSKAFIIKVSSISGALNFDKNLGSTLKVKLVESNWKNDKITAGFFESHHALLLKSTKQNSNIKTNALHLFFNAKNDSHFEIEIQCFGDKNIQNRFCKAIFVIKTLKLN